MENQASKTKESSTPDESVNPFLTETPSPKSKSSRKMFLIVPLLLLVGILIIFFALNFSGTVQTIQGRLNGFLYKANQVPTDSDKAENYAQTKFLFTSYPNFDELKIEDLPTFTDVRGVFDYKENMIVMGYKRLIELDTKTNKIVRTSISKNPEFSIAAKIGNILYVADNGDFFKNIQPSIHVLNLDDGAVVDVLKGGEHIPYDLINLDLDSHGQDLWIATRGEVLKFDTSINKLTGAYTLRDLGYLEVPTCDNALNMINEVDTVKVVEFACKEFISTYDYTTDTWAIQQFRKRELNASDYINKTGKDFGLDLESFVALSKKINDEYFALGTKGIYKITRDTLPELFYEKEIKGLFLNGNSYMGTSDGNSFIITSLGFTNDFYPILDTSPLDDALTIKKVDILTNTEVNLIESATVAGKPLSEALSENITFLYGADITVTDDTLTLKSRTENIKLTVNLTTGEIAFVY